MKIRPKEIRMSSHKAAREKIAKLNGFFAPKREERRIPPHIPPPHSHNIPTYVHIQKRAFAGESRDVTFPGEIRTYLYHLQKPERSRFHCSPAVCCCRLSRAYKWNLGDATARPLAHTSQLKPPTTFASFVEYSAICLVGFLVF